MTKKTEVTPVIFRKEYHRGTLKSWDVVAIFPCEPANDNPYELQAYAPVAQGWMFPDGYSFSSVSYDWYQQTAPASFEEYTPLMNEIKSWMGYENLKVYRKMQGRFLDARRDDIARDEIEYQLVNHRMYSWGLWGFTPFRIASGSRWTGVNPEYFSSSIYQAVDSDGKRNDFTNLKDAIRWMSGVTRLSDWRLVEESE